MLSRAAFVLITLFWLTMNVLLWRAEFGSKHGAGRAVPAAVVWQKLLTAPDNSSLAILRHGRRIGLCHWSTGVGEQWTASGEDAVAPGASEPARRYRLRFEGNAIVDELTNRVRFEANLGFAKDRALEELHARFGLRSFALEVDSAAGERSVRVKADADGVRFERVIAFSELQNPAALAREFLGPLAPEWLSQVDLPVLPPGPAAAGVKWEAWEDELRVGHARVKGYRLQTRLLERWQVTLYLSRAGELLRAELPEGLELADEQLTEL